MDNFIDTILRSPLLSGILLLQMLLPFFLLFALWETRPRNSRKAKGRALDSIGLTYALERKKKWIFFNENDNDYRARIMKVIKGDNHG